MQRVPRDGRSPQGVCRTGGSAGEDGSYSTSLATSQSRKFFDAIPICHAQRGRPSVPRSDHVIYVNAGATRPADIWLDRLNDGGRLILPLTSDKGFGENPENIPIQRRGAVFRIERRGDEFLAKWISTVAIFPCEGARDALSERALASAFEKGGWERVTRLHRRGDLPDDQCWLKAPDWALAYA